MSLCNRCTPEKEKIVSARLDAQQKQRGVFQLWISTSRISAQREMVRMKQTTSTHLVCQRVPTRLSSPCAEQLTSKKHEEELRGEFDVLDGDSTEGIIQNFPPATSSKKQKGKVQINTRRRPNGTRTPSHTPSQVRTWCVGHVSCIVVEEFSECRLARLYISKLSGSGNAAATPTGWLSIVDQQSDFYFRCVWHPRLEGRSAGCLLPIAMLWVCGS